MNSLRNITVEKLYDHYIYVFKIEYICSYTLSGNKTQTGVWMRNDSITRIYLCER